MIALVLGGAFFFFLVVQTTFFRMFGAFGPDMTLLFSLYCGLKFYRIRGYQIGIVAGLMQDALAHGILGINMLIKGIVGFAGGGLSEAHLVDENSPATWSTTIFLATVFNGLLLRIYFSGFYDTPFNPGETFLGAIFQAMLNVVVGIPFFWLLDRLQEWVRAATGQRDY